MIKCTLISANLEQKYWGEVACRANYLQNRLPSRAIQKRIQEKRRRLNEKERNIIFVGYGTESKACTLLNTSMNKILISGDLRFGENDVLHQEFAEIPKICDQEKTCETGIEEIENGAGNKVKVRRSERFTKGKSSDRYGQETKKEEKQERTEELTETMGCSEKEKSLEAIQEQLQFLLAKSELKEDMYMKQPEGFLEERKDEFVCKLQKRIYGLKQPASLIN
ncbi:hypothetical protein ILUMI_24807 [Ignelater luminosus]|uniref:Retroviral polymerase SH3-like domain-containing protein n=1 Tax=Ignelater luminosus TaxID=2038154 RepID=A0A8K0C6H6_IGNLU|nr:hypothetical protein ILUMI_24807 [Ignelater luminosus]